MYKKYECGDAAISIVGAVCAYSVRLSTRASITKILYNFFIFSNKSPFLLCSALSKSPHIHIKGGFFLEVGSCESAVLEHQRIIKVKKNMCMFVEYGEHYVNKF